MKLKREAKLAITAIIAVFVLVWGINYLKGTSLFDSRSTYYGIYDNVEGLKVSSAVMYRGYQVGQVMSISFTGKNFEDVVVKFSVSKDLELPKNSLAMIQSADLIGSKVLDLVPGDAPFYAESGDTLRSEVEQGLMQQVSRQMLPFKQKAENLLSSLDSVLVIVQGLFNDQTKENLANSFQSIDRTLKNLENSTGNLDTLIQTESTQISRILRNVQSITSNLEQNNEEISTILSNFADISDSIKMVDMHLILANFNSILNRIDETIFDIQNGEGTIGALLSDNDLYYNLNQTSENLNRLLVEFRYNPKKFINLSLIDFSSSSNVNLDEYAIVLFETEDRLPLEDELYLQNTGLKEIKHKGKYLYITGSYKKLKSAQKKLQDVIKSYPEAYIVKIDFM